MNCKICNPPSAAICPSCEAVIQAHVAKIMHRFGRIRKAIAQMDSRDLMRGEVKLWPVKSSSTSKTSSV